MSSSIAPEAPARRVKGYLVNPRFQLKYTGLLVAVVLGVMLGLGFYVYRLAKESAVHAEFAAEQAEQALKESQANEEATRMFMEANYADNPDMMAEVKKGFDEKSEKIRENLDAVRHRREGAASSHRRLLTTLVVSGALLLVLLGVLGIFITHKIVGPVHKLKRLLRQVGTGKLIVRERLRKGDEMGDLFDTFLQMTYSLKALQLGRLATLDAAIKQAEDAGMPESALAKLRELRLQTQLPLRTDRPSIPPPTKG